MKGLRYEVEIAVTEEILGTASAHPDLYREFIASKRPENVDEAELDALPDVDEELRQSTTVFPRTPDGIPCLWDYQIKGFFKDACGCLRRVKDSESIKRKAYKKEIDGTVFVSPRQIPAILPDAGEIGLCIRPLRAATAQGERIALARSESLPVGTRFQFTVQLLLGDLEGVLFEWLTYGQLRGLGQWRNSGKGRFSCTVTPEGKESILLA